jgi:hypothetical protein
MQFEEVAKNIEGYLSFVTFIFCFYPNLAMAKPSYGRPPLHLAYITKKIGGKKKTLILSH